MAKDAVYPSCHGSYIVLSTGREVAQHGEDGIVGIGPDLLVYAGYDDEVRFGPERKGDAGWTVAEKREFGLFMMHRWLRFLDNL